MLDKIFTLLTNMKRKKKKKKILIIVTKNLESQTTPMLLSNLWVT